MFSVFLVEFGMHDYKYGCGICGRHCKSAEQHKKNRTQEIETRLISKSSRNINNFIKALAYAMLKKRRVLYFSRSELYDLIASCMPNWYLNITNLTRFKTGNGNSYGIYGPVLQTVVKGVWTLHVDYLNVLQLPFVDTTDRLFRSIGLNTLRGIRGADGNAVEQLYRKHCSP